MTPTQFDEPRSVPHPADEEARRWRVAALMLLAVLVAGVVGVAVLLWPGADDPADVAAPPEPTEEPTEPDPAEDDADAGDPSTGDDPVVEYGEEVRGNWDVTGVALDSALNVRSGPGMHQPVAASLAGHTIELESTGRIAWVDGVLWREIVVPGASTGWVSATYLTETVPTDLPLAALETVDRIRDAAASGDWEALAGLALAGDGAFYPVVDQPTEDAAALAAFWREQAGDEPLADILLALTSMRHWHAGPPEGEAGVIHVSPAVGHEPTTANREALERAVGAAWAQRWVVDNEYVGWRVGVTADGDWRFFVTGD